VRILLISLLLAGAALAAACGAGPTTDPGQSGGSAGGQAALAALLPGDKDVPGWTVSRAPRSFTPDTLWELINGAADGFVAYGVQEVVTADYEQAQTGHEAVIEIYRMKDPLNAYGKYADERNPRYRFLEVGNEGYSGGTSVNFWTGPYYVKITAFVESDVLEKELVTLGRSIAAKVAVPGAEPRELSYFPKENQVPRSTLYLPKDVLAQSFFTNGFEARYETNGTEYKLVVIALDSEAAARDGLERYRQAIAKGGDLVSELTAPGEGGFAGKDSFYGNVAAVRTGTHVVVALGVPSEDAGVRQLAEVVGRIK